MATPELILFKIDLVDKFSLHVWEDHFYEGVTPMKLGANSVLFGGFDMETAFR